MGWRKDQREFATIDGLDFPYEEIGDTGGADAVLHNIATSGYPVYEPIGEGGKAMEVSAYFVGDDYLVDMDALMAILDKPQTHDFVHPYRGRMQVGLDGKYRVVNKRTGQGMCELRFRLVKVDNQTFAREPSFDVKGDAGFMIAELSGSYARNFNLGSFVKQIAGTIELAAAAMGRVEGKIQAAMSISESFGSAVTGFADQAGSLLRKPQDMITSMTGTAIGIMAAIANAPDSLPSRGARSFNVLVQAMEEIFAQERPSPPSPETPEGGLEFENSVQWWLANRVSFIAAGAQTMTGISFATSDEVDSFRASFLGFFDDVSGDPSLDDQIYSSIRQLKASTIGYLQGVAQKLPRLTTYRTDIALPALALNYAIYGNNDRNLELVERNNVKHPMFVPPRDLEIVNG